MTVSELIEKLKQLPPDSTVYYEGGEYADDWRRVSRVSNLNSWGTVGVLIE